MICSGVSRVYSKVSTVIDDYVCNATYKYVKPLVLSRDKSAISTVIKDYDL